MEQIGLRTAGLNAKLTRLKTKKATHQRVCIISYPSVFTYVLGVLVRTAYSLVEKYKNQLHPRPPHTPLPTTIQIIFTTCLTSYMYYHLSCCMCIVICMVCAYVREDNPRALASGLSPLYMQDHTITASLHQHACALCALQDICCRTLEYHSKVQ